MDIPSVITLGHSANVPLIRPSSELVDGFEPHGLFCSSRTAAGGTADARHSGWWGRGVPGVVQWVGTWEGAIPGTNMGTQPGSI